MESVDLGFLRLLALLFLTFALQFKLNKTPGGRIMVPDSSYVVACIHIVYLITD
jgi:hypothetical protein